MAISLPCKIQAPCASGNKNVAVIGPEATPPESNAIAVKILGTKKVKTKAINKPGTIIYMIEKSKTILVSDRPIAKETPTDKENNITLSDIAPSVICSTCLVKIATAGSTLTIKKPIIMPKGIIKYEGNILPI